MSGNSRATRLGDRIKEIVATMLERRIKDPRLGFVTVTDVELTGDLQHATVFYTVLGDAEELASSTAALESAKGLLRSEVGKQTGVKHTPTLTFQLDATPQNAAHVEEALREAAARDAEVAALAATATYAGEADPYRRPAVDDAGDSADDADPAEDERPS
ncbi:ribosome-binding factor A [Beutenbergia cavernae DSM 12333]|uniref:Ribosome-binding factor A n=1 Tax=Beutenbergia cavernae (strain ATCC BAA-8 / DSM 12333 / CCUG 43141 / JCM 11478 / NBRC 16432 / NCIMB 13614 / HKI 0122) TaxID=471853 RepID=RBFA_BEUC1|nr:30S ribosome-binding factor RbfA [Beutenbergia cavernae]C5BWS2.1 RecName: Full=Ribosome-binding factor A [Beutenbergia cavernae DSM 12333]ACQ80738.1 ribosome-binding factor A [Beutenbergia cavernae DSM 12333]